MEGALVMDTRCGLRCMGCEWKTSHGCGGCVETNGYPFHGECPVAICCQRQGYTHCGECDIIPCDRLYAYSYLEPEHGALGPRACVWKHVADGCSGPRKLVNINGATCY